MKKHPVIGAHIFSQFLPAYSSGPSYIRHHHEPNYPDKLTGDKIPFGSRIISVADKGIACREKRSWEGKRQTLTLDGTIDYMAEQRSTGQVDPEIADAWIQLAKGGSLRSPR